MNLKLLKNTDVAGKTVLYRSPYDIGVKEEDGKLVLKDDSRILATIPTLKYLLDQNCKIVILTWVKRPEGKVVEKLRTIPHAKALSTLLDHPVKYVPDCVGPEVDEAISKMQPRDILMLENVRFHPQEKEKDPVFTEALVKNAEIIVFDGFPQAHRNAASTTGILRQGLPYCAGLYLKSEVEALSSVIESPKHPLTLIIGGIKAESKIPVIENYLNIADNILIGGKLPTDPLLEPFRDNSKLKIATLTKTGLDISEESANEFVEIIKQSKTIIWAGPMGLFEKKKSAVGTEKIANAIVSTSAYKIVGGGDTSEAVVNLGLTDKFDFVSLAGGATLEFLSGKKLPVLELLRENS